MTTYSFTTELRDGTPILVRPIESKDRHLIEIGMGQLSPKSRYMRFFRPVSKLSKNILDDITTTEHNDHIAIGALDLTHSEPFPIGAARCVRLKDRPSEAEVAITVIDSHQGRGLGTILLAALSYIARDHDITTFVATVLSENHAMLKLFRELGATSHSEGDGILSVRVPIAKDAESCLDTPTGAVARRIYKLLEENQERENS